ncbi:hypothetical protein LVT18_17715, partial [Klebsiella pneumoniae]|nr:hypothetical protein [Klebsiella pneumoniae]
KACVLPENPASYRVVRTKSYLFNKAAPGGKTKPATQAFVIYALWKYDEQGAINTIFSCLNATPKSRMNAHSVISFFYLLMLS